jgi:hypothetical protein
VADRHLPDEQNVTHGERSMGLALFGVLAVGRTAGFDVEASLANGC